MPITMEDFVDECLTGKKKKKRRKQLKENKVDTSTIFEAEKDSSVVDKKEKEKEKEDQEEKEKTKQQDIVLKFKLTLGEKKEEKEYTKEDFLDDVPLNLKSILALFDFNMNKISNAAEQEQEQEKSNKVLDNIDNEDLIDKFKLSAIEHITSGAGNEKVELSWRRQGAGETAIETSEVITASGSIPFNNSPDPLNSAISTFDRVYYDDIVLKIREKLELEK
jgi:hypothetical protein